MKRRRSLIVVVILLVPVAVHAIWDQVESTLFAREVARVAQRREPVSVRFHRSALPTAEQRRGARIYAAAANLAIWKYRDDPRLHGREIEVERAFASGQPAALLEDVGRKDVEGEPALDLLALASTLEFSGFGPIAPELHENASPLVELNALNGLRADLLTARGDDAGAAGTLIHSVRLQRTIAREFYRYAAARRLYGSLRLLLRHAPPDAGSLLRLQHAFEELPDEDRLVEQLQTERARLLGDFWPYPPDRTVWVLRPRMFVRGGADTAAFFLFRPLITHLMRRQFKPFEDALAAARQPWPQKLDARSALVQQYRLDPDRPQSRRSFLDKAAGFLSPEFGILSLYGYMPIAGMNLAIRRTSIATLAVERFRRDHGGDMPATLETLVPEYLSAVPQDPFAGQPLTYRRAADSYVVYSIDVNRADDGGLLYGLGSGSTSPIRRVNDPSPRDIGIRVPLTPATF